MHTLEIVHSDLFSPHFLILMRLFLVILTIYEHQLFCTSSLCWLSSSTVSYTLCQAEKVQEISRMTAEKPDESFELLLQKLNNLTNKLVSLLVSEQKLTKAPQANIKSVLKY